MDDPRTEPVKVKVFLTTGEGMAVDWKDGHRSRYSFPHLRAECPCATCRERRTQGQSVTGTRVKSELPMYQEPIRAKRAEPVGNYAVRFEFSDDHTTGIYSFEHLREICPCEECRNRPSAGR